MAEVQPVDAKTAQLAVVASEVSSRPLEAVMKEAGLLLSIGLVPSNNLILKDAVMNMATSGTMLPTQPLEMLGKGHEVENILKNLSFNEGLRFQALLERLQSEKDEFIELYEQVVYHTNNIKYIHSSIPNPSPAPTSSSYVPPSQGFTLTVRPVQDSITSTAADMLLHLTEDVESLSLQDSTLHFASILLDTLKFDEIPNGPAIKQALESLKGNPSSLVFPRVFFLDLQEEKELEKLVDTLSDEQLRSFFRAVARIASVLTPGFPEYQTCLRVTIEEAAQNGRNLMEKTEKETQYAFLIQNAISTQIQVNTVTTTMETMTNQEKIQHAGRLLAEPLLSSSELSSTFSADLKTALENMKTRGIPLRHRHIDELKYSGAMKILMQKHLSKEQMEELEEAIAKAASCSISVPMIRIWSIVKEQGEKTFGEQRALEADEIELEVPDFEGIKQSTIELQQKVAVYLTASLNASMTFTTHASQELKDALMEMKTKGKPIASRLHTELNQYLSSLQLSIQQLNEIQQALEQKTQDTMQQVAFTLTNGAQLIQMQLTSFNLFDTRLIFEKGFENLEENFYQTRQAIDQAIDLAIGHGSSFFKGLFAFFPLLRFEIVRDFSQSVSLFFTNLYHWALYQSTILQSAKVFFGGFFNSIAMDFAAAFNSKRIVEIGMILTCCVYFAYVYFIITAKKMPSRKNEIRHGHEADTWMKKINKQKLRVRFFTWSLTACLSVYLPLTRFCIEILFKLNTSFIYQRFGQMKEIYLLLQIASGIVLGTFTFYFPLFLIQVINENKPRGTIENHEVIYDLDGEQVEFDDKVYTRLVTHDPNQLSCPYRSLYLGFEKKWSHYKVIQLFFKVMLILPLLLITNEKYKAICSCCICFLLMGISFYGTPFVDPMNDLMEMSGKLTLFITSLGGTLLIWLQDTSSSDHLLIQNIIGIIINLVNYANLALMIGFFFFGMEKARFFIKNHTGSLSFSDTVRDVEDVTNLKQILPLWDIEREIKHRIWHAFWKNLLFNKCGRNVSLRLIALEKNVMESGIQNIRNHWKGGSKINSSKIVQMRQIARQELEGIDVYWNDPSGTLDGHLDSMTCFGKMYIHPYPFHCIMVYDDASDETILRDENFEKFFFLNFSEEILKKRQMRFHLRALSQSGQLIKFPFCQKETIKIEDGVEIKITYDSQGKKHQKEEKRYSIVEVDIQYTKGLIQVHANTRKQMADGFHVKMIYTDGQGVAIAPRTGQRQQITGRRTEMGPEHLGIDAKMEENEILKKIFIENQHLLKEYGLEIKKKHQQYRQELIDQQVKANQTLSDGFWYFIYNNPQIERSNLEKYLAEEETNSVLKNVASQYANALDFLYKRMDFVKQHAAIRLWYVFWDDVYTRNGQMKVFQDLEDDFSPMKHTSICYRLMKKEELIGWLQTRKLWGHSSFFSWKKPWRLQKTLFHEQMINLLYEEMDKLLTTTGTTGTTGVGVEETNKKTTK